MYDKLILYSEPQQIFLNEIARSGYGSTSPSYLISNRLIHWNNNDYKKIQAKKKNKIFQMCLISDKVILPALSSYDSIEDTSFIEFEYMNNEYSRLNLYDNSPLDQEFALYIRPLVILNKSKLFNLSSIDFFTKEDVSIIYDYFYLPSPENTILFNNYLSQKWIHMYKNSLHNTIHLCDSEETLSDIIKKNFDKLVNEIIFLLQISAENECPLIQNSFDLSPIITTQNYLDTSSISAYQILRINCEHIIGELPVLNTFNDLVYLKNHHSKDIVRLKNVLSEFENRIRTDGQYNAVKKLTTDIHKASKELTKHHMSEKVSKFAQYLSVPIGIAEVLTSMPPIVGLSIQAVGFLSELSTEAKRRKNNWLNVVR